MRSLFDHTGLRMDVKSHCSELLAGRDVKSHCSEIVAGRDGWVSHVVVAIQFSRTMFGSGNLYSGEYTAGSHKGSRESFRGESRQFYSAALWWELKDYQAKQEWESTAYLTI
jgi:hypothetical protein